MNLKHLIGVAALCLCVVNLHADTDDAAYLWDHPEEVRVDMADLSFVTEKFNATKNDSVFLMSYFNDGWVLMFHLFQIDHKLFDRWGMYALVADPDGNSYWKTLIAKKRDVELLDDRLFYTDGVNTLESADNSYRISCDFDGFTCDLEFEPLISAWKPGTGRENFTEDGRHFQSKQVFLPVANVSGTLSVDGLELSVSGYGYGEKTLFVYSLIRHPPYITALRLYTPYEKSDEEYLHIGVHESTLAQGYGGRKLTRLVAIRDGAWLFTTPDYVFEPVEMAMPEFANYEYPAKYRLYADANGYTLDGFVTETNFFHYTDIFSALPTWLRKTLQLFFKRPVFFRYATTFEGTLTDPGGTVHDLLMTGPNEYVVTR